MSGTIDGERAVLERLAPGTMLASSIHHQFGLAVVVHCTVCTYPGLWRQVDVMALHKMKLLHINMAEKHFFDSWHVVP